MCVLCTYVHTYVVCLIFPKCRLHRRWLIIIIITIILILKLGNLCNGKQSDSIPNITTTNNNTNTPTTTGTKSIPNIKHAFRLGGGRGTSARYTKNDENLYKNQQGHNYKYQQQSHHHHDLQQPPPSSSVSSCKILSVSKKDRNKFCGSLPNHLDSDDVYDDEFQQRQHQLLQQQQQHPQQQQKQQNNHHHHQQQRQHQQQNNSE